MSPDGDTHTCIIASQDRCTKRRVVIWFEFVVLSGVTDFFYVCNWARSVFHDMFFVMCAVRLITRHHDVACAVSLNNICFVFSCVLILSIVDFCDKHNLYCVHCKPTEHIPWMCIRILSGCAFTEQKLTGAPTYRQESRGGHCLLSERSLSYNLSSSDSVRKDRRVGAGSRSTQRGPLECGITYARAHDCPCVVCGTRQCLIHIEKCAFVFEDPSRVHDGTQISQQIISRSGSFQIVINVACCHWRLGNFGHRQRNTSMIGSEDWC